MSHAMGKTFETYRKRAGTSDHGKEYEKLVSAFFALKFSTCDDVVNFQMTTNNESYGDFDYLSLDVMFSSGKSHMFLIQLKHSNNKKNITDRHLISESGDFSLLKYFKSFQKLESKENMSCVLFTNNSSSIKNNSRFFIKNEEIIVKQASKVDSEIRWLLNWKNKKKTTKVFQFALAQTSKASQEFDTFLQHFYFLINQNNLTEVEFLMSRIMEEHSKIDKEGISLFKHFIQNWWSSNFVIKKKDILYKLCELTLSPFLLPLSDEKCNDKTRILQEAIMNFEITIVEELEDILLKMWSVECSHDEIALTALKYGLSVSRNINLNNLSIKEKSKVFWYLGKVPFIVKLDDCNIEAVRLATKFFKKCSKDRTLVIVGNIGREEFPEWNVFESLSDLLNEKIYTDIIHNYFVSLQGRHYISLKELIDCNKDIISILSVQELCKMSQAAVQIGSKEENSCEDYISRNVSTVFLDLDKVLDHCVRNNTFKLVIYNCIDSCRSKIVGKNVNMLNMKESDENLSQKKFDVIVTRKTFITKPKLPDDKNVHLFQIVDENCCMLVGGSSKPDVELLSTMKIEKIPVNERDCYSYFDVPIKVVCAPPGMGKSMLFSYLSTICPPNFLCIRVALIHFTSFFKKEPAHSEILLHFIESVYKDQDIFCQKIQLFFLKSRKVHIFLDGLDEIDSSCISFVLKYVQYMSSEGFHVWVSSRLNFLDTIYDELHIFPITIEEFTEEQQKTYIEKRLKNVCNTSEVMQITDDVFRNVDVTGSRFLLGIPLQLYIITENFRNDKNLFKEINKNIFVLSKMYRIFFTGKKSHQYRKIGVDEYEHQLGFDFEDHLEQYEMLALKSCFKNEVLEKLALNWDRSLRFLAKMKKGDPFGIIERVSDEEQVFFVHQTFAEYFVCVWLFKHVDKILSVLDVFSTKKYQNLKLMFDIMLAEKCPLHLATIYGDLDLVKANIENIEMIDDGGRNVLQVLCSYGERHPLLGIHPDPEKIFLKEEFIFDLFYSENQIHRESETYQTMLDLFLRNNVFEKDTLFEWNSLEYAAHFQNLFAVDRILHKFEDVNLDCLYKCYDINTLAYYSCQLGYCSLLSVVIKKDPNIVHFTIGREGLSLFHVAVLGSKNENYSESDLYNQKNAEIIKILAQHGLDVNVKDERSRAAFHLAAERGCLHTLQALIDCHANINQLSSNGRNALHFVFTELDRNNEIVKLLISNNINVNVIDRYGKTPLYLACRIAFDDAVEILLDSGANVVIDNKDYEERRTILDAATRCHKIEVETINLLIRRGADVNDKDFMGRTALHYAVYHARLDLVKILIDEGADPNILTNGNDTCLHFALKSGEDLDLIQFLLDLGIDVNAVGDRQRTFLHIAAKKGSFELIKLLFKYGVNVLAVTDKQRTALHCAILAKHPKIEVIQFLVENGVEADARDTHNKTVLDYAVIHDYREIIEVFFTQYGFREKISNDCVSFLHYAVYNGNCDVVKYFLDEGLQVDKVDIDSEEYPLYFAVKENRLQHGLLLKMTQFVNKFRSRSRVVNYLKEQVSAGCDVNLLFDKDYHEMFSNDSFLCFTEQMSEFFENSSYPLSSLGLFDGLQSRDDLYDPCYNHQWISNELIDRCSATRFIPFIGKFVSEHENV